MADNSLYKGLISGSDSSADSQPAAPAAPPPGGSVAGSKYADDPGFQAWRSQNPHVPDVVMDNAFENARSRAPGGDMPVFNSLVQPVDPYHNLANRATGKMYK